jgi:hypothetical protein
MQSANQAKQKKQDRLIYVYPPAPYSTFHVLGSDVRPIIIH